MKLGLAYDPTSFQRRTRSRLMTSGRAASPRHGPGAPHTPCSTAGLGAPGVSAVALCSSAHSPLLPSSGETRATAGSHQECSFGEQKGRLRTNQTAPPHRGV